MLGKLLKYEFKYYYKSLSMLYIFTLFSGLILKLCSITIDKVPVLSIPLSMLMIISILAIMFLPFFAFIVSIKRFYQTVAKDQGYLTNTLPVSKRAIVLSKLIASTIASTVAILVSIGSVLLVLTTETNVFNPLKEFFTGLFDYDALLLVLIPLYMLIMYLFVVLLVYAAISLGQRKSNRKLAYSIGYGFVLYFILQIVFSILIYVLDSMDLEFVREITYDYPKKDLLNIALTIFVGVYGVICYIFYRISVHNLDKNLNLE